MDFNLNARQNDLLSRTESLLGQEVFGGEPLDGVFDARGFGLIRDAGLLEVARGEQDTALLDAVLVVERVSKAAVLAPVGLHAVVLPVLFNVDPGSVAAISEANAAAPVRFGAQAELVIRYQGADAVVHRMQAGSGKAVDSNYVYPLGALGTALGEPLASAPARLVRRRHRIVIAAEAVGVMEATLDQIVEFLTHRKQFGRRLGSFQALHHRLAELSILLESARWLTRDAAYKDDNEAAALAAAFAANASRRFAWDVHQLAGARGFTLEMGLYRHTLRSQVLSVEAGGAKAHSIDAAKLRWLANAA